MPRLTKKVTEGAPVTNKHYYLWDDQISGFGLRVLPSGNKSYVVQYRYAKRVCKLIIGPYPVFSLDDARVEASEILRDVRKGIDPKAKRTVSRNVCTVDDLATRYLDEYCMAHQKPGSRYTNRLTVNNHIKPILGSRNINEVTRSDIADLHVKMAKTPIMGNRTLGVLSKMFSLAELWGLRDEGSNPCRRIKKYAERKRDRYLTYDEATAFGKALQEHKHYPDQSIAAIYCLQLLLLTGCRVGELLSLEWKFIDFDRRRIFLPETKTGARTVYLGPSAISLLREIEACAARPADNPYVIWGDKPQRPLSGLKRPWAYFRKLLKIEDVRIHDLRHSFASFALNQNVSLATIGKLLGHTNMRTTARYAHLMEGPTTDAAELVADQIGALIAIPQFKVKKLPAQRHTAKVIEFIPKTNVPMPQYFTSDQAALYLGLEPKSMKDWRYRKVGPRYEKICNRIRYNQASLDEFLKQRTVAAV